MGSQVRPRVPSDAESGSETPPVAALPGRPPLRVLVETGDYKFGNLGDVAMLQVCYERLRDFWPEARIEIFTSDPRGLERFCPGATPLGWRGRATWFSNRALLGRLHAHLPDRVARRLGEWQRALRGRAPSVFEALWRFRLGARSADFGELSSFVSSVRRADLVVVVGAGGMTDHAANWAEWVLNLVEMARKLERPTVLFGQGLGPVQRPELLTRLREVLPSVNLLALREKREGLPLAHALGVPEDVILVTGDDAVDLAFKMRPTGLGQAMGVNIRVSRSAHVDAEMAGRIAPVLRKLAERLKTRLLPIPISFNSFEGTQGSSPDGSSATPLARDWSDGDAYERILEGPLEASALPRTPEDVIAQVGRCRLVVTGAYHAAVFALAQGIPVVCMSGTRYFEDKFLGLADMFGLGCQVVLLNHPDLPDVLADAVGRAWASADDVHDALLAASARQIGDSRSAYQRAAAIAIGSRESAGV